MNRILRQPMLFLLVTLAAMQMGSVQSVQAAQRVSIFQIADSYRGAVKHFITEARRSRYADRQTVRLIARLEDESSDLRSAARHPKIINRLLSEYIQVESLQYEVEVAVFGRGDPNVAFNLWGCWEEVVRCQQLLAAHLRLLQQGSVGIVTSHPPYGLLPSAGHVSLSQRAYRFGVHPGNVTLPPNLRYRGPNWVSSRSGTTGGASSSPRIVGGPITAPRAMPPVMSQGKR